MKLNDLPKWERPREKMMRYGPKSLSDIELLAIIIGSGTKENNALDISYEILKNGGLYSLINTPYQELEKIKGISAKKSLTLASIIEIASRISMMKIQYSNDKIDSKYIYNKYKTELLGYNQEIMGLIVLSKKGKVLSEKIMFKGTDNNIYISHQEIIREVLLNHGSKFYVFHNHPGESSFPSDLDIAFTMTLVEEAKKYGFEMLDHIIISKKDYFSFHESKY